MSDESPLKCEKRLIKSSRNKMLIFGLCSISDDHPSNLNDESQLKCKKKKWPPKLSKSEMHIFGLHSTSDDWLSNLSNEI